MMVICEFEFVEDKQEGGYLAIPFGMGGVTEGDTLEDAVAMAVDLLHMEALDALLHGRELPSSGVGNAPREGGTVMAVAVPVRLEDAPAVTAAQAAGMLGVSAARVAQMCAAGQLASWKVGRTRMVALESIEERNAACPAPGRPRSEQRGLLEG